MSIFDKTCDLVEKIPTMELTTHFFWSVMWNSLVPEDRVKLVEELMDKVTSQEEGGDEHNE